VSAAFYLKKLQPLIGAEVVGLVKDENDEFYGLQLRRDNRRFVLWFSSDDEGNGPGSFDLEVDGRPS